MHDFPLILSSLRSRWLNSALSVFLTAFGVMLAVLIIQFSHHVHSRLSTDGQGIDIVVGAKGSPLQLILSSVYHIDIPTGNIPYKTAEKWINHPQIKTAIPLALGDNWQGHRIVGTRPAYMTHYGAELSDGRVWKKSFEAVAGANTGLKLGDTLVGAHGLTGNGHAHDHDRYTVTGVMKPTGSVLDRLILTSLDSVLEIHGQDGVDHVDHEHHDHDHGHDHDDHAHHKEDDHHEHGHDHAHEEKHSDHGAKSEITAVLLTTKTPIATMNLPRRINRESALQAANPALEMARLTSMLGLGSQSFTALSFLLITISALSVFAGLAGSLENRMSDLAILRAIGYSKRRLFKIITLEGMIIVISGVALGLLMGLIGFNIMTKIIPPLAASGAKIVFTSELISVTLIVFLAGLIATLIPALRASRVSVAEQLSRNA